MLVREIMTRDVTTLSPDSTIREAMETLYSNHLGGAPVVRGSRVVGVMSMTDIADLLVNIPEPVTIDGDSLLDEQTVEDAMSREVIGVSPGTPVKMAATLMKERAVHRVIVMEEGHLVGILSAMDVARAVSDESILNRTGVRLAPRCDEQTGWTSL